MQSFISVLIEVICLFKIQLSVVSFCVFVDVTITVRHRISFNYAI